MLSTLLLTNSQRQLPIACTLDVMLQGVITSSVRHFSSSKFGILGTRDTEDEAGGPQFCEKIYIHACPVVANISSAGRASSPTPIPPLGNAWPFASRFEP